MKLSRSVSVEAGNAQLNIDLSWIFFIYFILLYFIYLLKLETITSAREQNEEDSRDSYITDNSVLELCEYELYCVCSHVGTRGFQEDARSTATELERCRQERSQENGHQLGRGWRGCGGQEELEESCRPMRLWRGMNQQPGNEEKSTETIERLKAYNVEKL